MKYKVAIFTLGCKVNQYESEKMKQRFASLGFDVVSEAEPADVYIVNSCTVTGLADRKSRNFARRGRKLNPDALVVMAGCYVETAPQLLGESSFIDMLVGAEDKNRLPEIICERLYGSERAAETTAPEGISPQRTRAYLKVQDGCDRYCAYCIIPYARGPVRSRPCEELISEAGELLSAGYREIIITGINAALYRDENSDVDLLSLVGNISHLHGDFRLRLSSLEPTTVNAAYANRLVRNERLCPHLHLSLQSGSDRILSAMGRGYSMEEYYALIDVLRERDPLFGITTDLIVGFPGETEGDFEASVRAVEQIGFAHVHVFRYSPRPGTRAADMEGQLPEHVKKERSDVLIGVAKRAEEKYRQLCEGSVRQALVLGESGRDGYMRALTDNGVETEVRGGLELTNTFLDVRL